MKRKTEVSSENNVISYKVDFKLDLNHVKKSQLMTTIEDEVGGLAADMFDIVTSDLEAKGFM